MNTLPKKKSQPPEVKTISPVTIPLSHKLLKKKRPPANYTSLWIKRDKQTLTTEQAHESMALACQWLIEQSMFQGKHLPKEQNPHGYHYDSWDGAMREYDAANQQWEVFGPLWHTGQAIKAFVGAYRVLNDEKLLLAAKRSADFILHAQITDPKDPDFGAIYAFENGDPTISTTSCMLESLDGLIELAKQTRQPHYWQAVIDCLHWAIKRLFIPEEGLFYDDFDIRTRQAQIAPNTQLHGVPGRPLLDDAVFLKAAVYGDDAQLRDVFFTIAQRLLGEESPSGNWIGFPPCDQIAGILHPRQAYWWGKPMIAAWQESQDPRFLQCAKRAGDWYVQAQRIDGGMFRMTTTDFCTTTTGQATSGILCAACLWSDLMALGDGSCEHYRLPLQRALRFGYQMQLRKTKDPALLGAIVEKTNPPNGTDVLPYGVRDLGAIFYVQALVAAF